MILRAMLVLLLVGTGKASHARQVKGDDPDKKKVGIWGMRLIKLAPLKKTSLLRSLMDARQLTLVIWEQKFKRWQMKAVEREEQ